MERIHEGILSQDQHKRYCLYEPGMHASAPKANTTVVIKEGVW